MNDNNVKG